MKSNKMGFENLKLSSKMHLLIIISSVVIAIGLAVGIICQFVANGFFNYNDDYANYKSVTVDYEDIDFSGSGKEPREVIDEICTKSFEKNGVSYYLLTQGNTTTGGKIVYKFAYSANSKNIDAAVAEINAEIEREVEGAGGIQFSYASSHVNDAILGNGLSLSRAAIAVATVIAVHFIYFAIRYRLTMALAAVLADVHNLALYIALVALCRIPVGSAIATFAVLTVLFTVIGTCFTFERMRKNLKSDEYKKLSAFELSDRSANETLLINVTMPACLAALSLILFVVLSISSLSPFVILAPVFCSLIAFIVCAYGTAIFVPSVYPRFKQIGDNVKAKSKAKTLQK